MNRKKTIMISASIFMLIFVVIGCFAAIKVKEAKEQTKIIDALYMQTENAINSHVDLIEIMDDVTAYEKRYVDNPNWENLNNLRVAINYASKSLQQISTEVIFLDDEQLDAARELGFDVSGLMVFCDAEIKSNLESNKTSLINRSAMLENFMIESTYSEMKNRLSFDEKEIKWNKEYLLLSLQNLWADFSEYGIQKKIAEKFPKFFESTHKWETDKEVLLEKTNKHISVYEDILSGLNRTLGNSEAMYEIEKKEGLKAAMIEGIPAMVIDPFFPTDELKTVTYKNADNEEIVGTDIDAAVEKTKKCTIKYENVSYSEYNGYLLKMKLLKYPIKECVRDERGNTTSVVYLVGLNEYVVRYENDTVYLDIDNIDNMVIVPYWYISEISPEAIIKAQPQKKEAKKDTEKNTATYFDDKYVIPEEDMKVIQASWDNALAYYDKRISATEKALEYEKSYLDDPTADNLLNSQIMVHLALKEFESGVAPDMTISEDIKNKMLSKEAYERAVENCASAERRLITLPMWKSILDDYVWNSAYYNNAKHLLETAYQNQTEALEVYKSYLTFNVHLAAQNLDEENRKAFLEDLYKKYPSTLNSITINLDFESEYFKVQSLENINYLYDKISETVEKASAVINQFRQKLNELETVTNNLGTEKECFSTPDGLSSERAIPWVFSYIDAECDYTLSDVALDKNYLDITPDDINSYSITYANKTYEDALEGIDRLISKDIEVVEDIIDETSAIWKINKNGKKIIYEWKRDKVTMYFPNKEFIIVPYGWYYYFR